MVQEADNYVRAFAYKYGFRYDIDNHLAQRFTNNAKKSKFVRHQKIQLANLLTGIWNKNLLSEIKNSPY